MVALGDVRAPTGGIRVRRGDGREVAFELVKAPSAISRVSRMLRSCRVRPPRRPHRRLGAQDPVTLTALAAAVTQILLDAFVIRRVAVITYQVQHINVTEWEIELRYLYDKVPVWPALRMEARSWSGIGTSRCSPAVSPLSTIVIAFLPICS